MITRDDLIHEIALRISASILEQKEPPLNIDKLAEAALDAVMDKVADPLINVLEMAEPFGRIAADQLRKVASK